MPGADDIRWVKTTANELNNLLLAMTQSARFLEEQVGHTPETEKYFAILRTSIERATQVSKIMLERCGSAEQAAITPAPLPQPVGVQTIDMPAPPSPPPAAAPPGIQINNPQGPNELILIVDDENFVTVLAQRVLTDAGYRVICAKDGFEALDIYKKLSHEISLVILDFTMPIMDGSEVFNELRLINARAPVVLSSGFSEQDKLKWMLAKGLRGFIPKPYSQQKLLLQVRSTLDALGSERGK